MAGQPFARVRLLSGVESNEKGADDLIQSWSPEIVGIRLVGHG
jgi:hypothetical protein